MQGYGIRLVKVYEDSQAKDAIRLFNQFLIALLKLRLNSKNTDIVLKRNLFIFSASMIKVKSEKQQECGDVPK